MKKLKRVFGSVANLAGGRGSDQLSSGGSGSGGLTSEQRSASGSLQDTSPRRGSYYSYETRSLDSFTSGQSGSTSPADTVRQDKNFTKLHKWANIGDTLKLKKFIKKVEVDARDSDGRTPLHHAAGAGRGDAVLFLLGSKADAEARDNTGTTPLLRAVEYSQILIVQMLLQRRVDVRTADNHGQTCVHIAAKSGAIDLLLLLLECGGDCDAVNSQGRTPLHRACSDNQEEAANTLLRHGANVNMSDNEGVTPLMLAAKVGCVGLVESLLDHGAALDPVDASQWSAADYARFTNHNQLHHRLTTLAQNNAAESSLVPQGLLSVSDEGSDPTDCAAGKSGGDKPSSNNGNNSWSDDSDVVSVREKPKINLAKFLPSSDESGDNTTVPSQDPDINALGPPKPPRLYTSFSSLTSEGDGARTECAAEGEEEASHKEDNSWKTSSEDEEEQKPKFKSRGLFMKDLDSNDDNRDAELRRKSSILSITRVGKEDMIAELGLSDMKYHSSEEDVSFEEDEKPMLPLEGTPTKVVLSRRGSENMEVSPKDFDVSENVPSSSHQVSLTKNLSPKNSCHESPSRKSASFHKMRTDSVGQLSSQTSEYNNTSRRVSVYSTSPIKSPNRTSPKRVRGPLRKSSAFDSDSKDEASSRTSIKHTSLTPTKNRGSDSVSDEVPLSQKGSKDSQRLSLLSGEMDETSFISNHNSEAGKYQTSGTAMREANLDNEDSVKSSSGSTKGIDTSKMPSGSDVENMKSGPYKSGRQSKEGELGQEGTLGREGTMQEVEEVWEANPSRATPKYSSSSSLSCEAKQKHYKKKVSGRPKQSDSENDKANSKGKNVAGSISQRDANNSRNSVEFKETENGCKDIIDGFKTCPDQDDTAQDITDEELASNGVEDLLDSFISDTTPVSVPAQKKEKSQLFDDSSGKCGSTSQIKKEESPTTDTSSHYTKLRTKTKSRKSKKQIKPASTSLEKSISPGDSKDGVNASKDRRNKSQLSVSRKSPEVKKPGWREGTVAFSDDDGEGNEGPPPWNMEEGEDGLSTETEESGHINVELKDTLLAPLSSLPDAWDAGQLRDLVRELRLKLEKEVGQRAASETSLSHIRHQERHTQQLCAKLEEALQQQQQEVTKLNAVIKQMEYQGHCQQDSGQLQKQWVEEWQSRCEQLEEECRSLHAQAQRQDQLVDSLMLQLQTKDTVNNTLHARLQEVASTAKYVSMKSCQTDDIQILATTSQSTYSQTDIVCLSRLEASTQSDFTIAGSDVMIDHIVSNKDKKSNSSPVLSMTAGSTKPVSSVAATQTEQMEDHERVTAVQDVRSAMISTGVQHIPERVNKYSQVQIHSRSVHIQTQCHTKTEVTDSRKMCDSSCQTILLSHQAASQTDPFCTKISDDSCMKNQESGECEEKESSQINLFTSALDSLLQNFSVDIKASINEASLNNQTAGLQVSKTVENHLNNLITNISSTLQQGLGENKTLYQLEESLQHLKDTLQYQQDIIMRISDDATDIKSNNLQDIVQEVNSSIQLKLVSVEKELNNVQGSQDSNKKDIANLVLSLKSLKDSNEKLEQLISQHLTLNKNSDISEELDYLKQQLCEHLQMMRNVVEQGGSAEDSGVSFNKSVMERLDTIEKSLSLSLGKNCTTEDISDLQHGIQRLSQDIDKKVFSLEGRMATKGEIMPDIQAVEDQLRGLKESTEGLTCVVRTGVSEQNAELSEALEENFQILQSHVQRLQQTLLQRINEVAERLNVAEDQQATQLSRQMSEVAMQVAGVHNQVMQVQAWVDRADSRPSTADTLDQALVSSLKASSDHTLSTLTQQNYSILNQLEALQREAQLSSSRGQVPSQAVSIELQHLKDNLREKENNLTQLQANHKDLQDKLHNQRSQMDVYQQEAEEQRARAKQVKEQLEIQEAGLRERQEIGRKEVARTAEELLRFKEENLRLSTEAGRLSASLEMEQQQRRWCESQLQILQDSRDAAEKRTQELLAALPPPSLHRTPPTGRDKQEDEAASKKQEAHRKEIEKLEAEKHEIQNCLAEHQGQTQHLNLQLQEIQAQLTMVQQEKSGVEVQLKKARETISKLQQSLSEARQQQEAISSLEDLRQELEGELQARDSLLKALKSKVEILNKEKLQLKQDILTMKGEKLSHELLKQEKEFSEEMQRKTEAQLCDLQRKIPQEYVTRTSLELMKKELETKYQRELTTKLAELQRSLDEKNKQHESFNQTRESREQQLREELNRKSEEIVRLNARLSMGEEREDTWRVRHDRLLALYQQGAAPLVTTVDTNNTSLDYSSHPKKLSQDSLSVTLQEIDQHLKIPCSGREATGPHLTPAAVPYRWPSNPRPILPGIRGLDEEEIRHLIQTQRSTHYNM
ncbi:hypothetical protein Pmani_021052 [Petrolisthes manimaculis]|uniref:Uncharacterized protein n=1 Tax=Petrolisthes manimaculis TaxID=1843537 RepID=A0AAE1U5V6_9EUCA|nr:hypothetical protein Pmani_021052 [Petrolisthes manimaculis]